MTRRTLARRRAAAVLIVTFLLAPAVGAAFAGAGTLNTFLEGTSVPVTARDPGSFATFQFPNPSRVVAASVNISTQRNFQLVSLPGPERGWWTEMPGCATLVADLAPLQGTPLTLIELALVAGVDGGNWTATGNSAKPALLLEFNATAYLGPDEPPALQALLTLSAKTDGSTPQEQRDLTAAVFELAPNGRLSWRQAGLAPDPLDGTRLTATVVHPPVRADNGSKFVDILVVPRNTSALSLEVDGLTVRLHRPLDPLSPSVFVNQTGESVWTYSSPIGLPARFGRTTEFLSGNGTNRLTSNGSAVDGHTESLFVPANASVSEALVDLSPLPSAGSAAGNDAGVNYSVAPLSADAAPSRPTVSGLPITAHPTGGTVTMYGLSALGVVDAKQEASPNSQAIGNLSFIEYSAAQTFTITQTGELQAVAINLLDASAHPVGTLRLELHDILAGLPGTTTLAVGATNVTAARSGGWVNFSLSPALAVAAGQQYAILLLSPGAAANETWEWRAYDADPMDPYAGGGSFRSANASGQAPWNPRPNIDFAFRALLETPFNESHASLLSVAGASAPATRITNYSGNLTGFQFLVPGLAVALEPDFLGGGLWNITVANGLGYTVEFRWDAAVDFELYPRNVELAVGNRSAFLTLPEISGPTVVDFASELSAALAAGERTEAVANGTAFWQFDLRARADGPAGILFAKPDVGYSATVRVQGFVGAMNAGLTGIPPSQQPAALTLLLNATTGQLVLEDPILIYSEPPQTWPLPPSPINVQEDAMNVTLLDLYQYFTDDFDGFQLSYSVVSVLPTVGVAGIFLSAVDANLTLTITTAEYSGLLFVTVRGVDSTGLSSLLGPIRVNVIPTDDPPQVPSVLPDLVLVGTTGTFDLSAFLQDNDTPVDQLNVSVSSVFSKIQGLNLSFDYRAAPANLLEENVTVTVRDGNSTVTTRLRVLVNNAGRPILHFPPQLEVTRGRSTVIALGAFATDDRDVALTWELLRVEGVGATPGDGSATLRINPSSIEITGTAVGDLDVGLSAYDTDRNLVSGTLHVRVVPNPPPVFHNLTGTHWSVASGGELRIDLRDYLSDPNDDFTNFTFNVAWDNGTVVNASLEGGVVVVKPQSELSGRAVITITATDPSSDSDTAEFVVEVTGSALPGGGALLIGLALAFFAAVGITFLLMRSRRKRGRPSLTRFEREQGAAEADEAPALLESPAGLEVTEEERAVHKLDEMEKEAQVSRIELQPATILSLEGPRCADSILLLYRDGQPITWVATHGPSDEERGQAEELAAILRERLKKVRAGERIEGESVAFGGRKIAIEARAQLMAGAVLVNGVDEDAARERIRRALDLIFDNNAGALKRWDGSRSSLKGVDDVLEGAFKLD